MSEPKRPNILLITTDQQRGDCLGLENHPVLQTPNLDHIGRSGTHFRRGYAECPSCVPARRTLLSGQSPAANGMVGYADGREWNPRHTLAGELSKAGYQTELVGKLHMHPRRKRYGFDHMRWADASHGWGDKTNDYIDWLNSTGDGSPEGGNVAAQAHGVSANGWVGRPFHLPENRTHTYWCASEAIDFLNKRDPSSPFFLYVSFIDPHPPLTPPQFHYDRYASLDLPKPVVGDWAPPFDKPQRGLHVDASRIRLDERAMHYARAAYYGMINHVDDQVGRIMQFLQRQGLANDTFILFTSDHGEMLGDHNMFRKTFAYEASARVPFIARGPASLGLKSETVIDSPVGLQDVMPTLLDVAGVPIPETVTGKSLLPLMRGESKAVRDVLHGEHSPCYDKDDGVEFLTDGHEKFIWYTQTGREQLFNLDNDPDELRDLAKRPDADAALQPWRRRMVDVLRDRPEGFVRDGALVVGRPHSAVMPSAN